MDSSAERRRKPSEIRGITKVKLNLGCGKTVLSGFVNVDCETGDGVDKVWDLNKFPYPWETSSIDEIRMEDVLEHLEKPKETIWELWRIGKNGARVQIIVPWHKYKPHMPKSNPEHKHIFAPEWFTAFVNKEVWGAHPEKPKQTFRIIGIRKEKQGVRIHKKIPIATYMATFRMHVEMEVIK
jgi:hypothetical protein